MLKLMAKKGAVGGTARFAAQGFTTALEQELISIKKNRKSFKKELEIVVALAMTVRFQSIGGVNNPDFDAIGLAYNHLGPGLENFTVAVLAVEAGFFENTPENQEMFREVIREELRAAGVPEGMI